MRVGVLLRFAEASDAVLFESRGTVALCFGEFKEVCVHPSFGTNSVNHSCRAEHRTVRGKEITRRFTFSSINP